MAEAHNNGSEEPIALLSKQQGDTEVVIDIDDGKEEASLTQNSALVVTSSFRRRVKRSLPNKQISVGRNQQGNNNDIGVVFIDTNGKVEEEEVPLAGGSQLGDVELGPVDVPEEPIPDAGNQFDNEQDKGASPPPKQVDADGGLPEQALMTILGNYIERVGHIIALIGLGTITSTIGGLFTRGPPVFFRYIIDPDNENDDGDDTLDALILYYKCLPAFFVVGLLELCYGIWVSRNHSQRAGKLAKTILILSAILLLVTVCFTGAGVSV